MPDEEIKVSLDILMAKQQNEASGLTCKLGSKARLDSLLSGRYDEYGYNQKSFRDMSIQLHVRCHQPRKAHSRVPNQVGLVINPCHGIVRWDTCQPLGKRMLELSELYKSETNGQESDISDPLGHRSVLKPFRQELPTFNRPFSSSSTCSTWTVSTRVDLRKTRVREGDNKSSQRVRFLCML